MSIETKNGHEPVLETVIVGEAKGPGVVAPSKLGEGKTVPTKQLDSFENPAQDLDYTIVLDIPEFTCLCPITGQPDFARFTIEYRPDLKCVETKSLKLYMWSFRNEGAFHEAVTNSILRDLVKVLDPKWIKITGIFNARGGITPTIISQWEKPKSA
ncbi:MAG: NADPH-dependent 7-cyano-7-deazaguanine reductase QueF [Chloroflexi bacterium]|nr:NADPH-dependent 7-cyano-7-deazaguanine reductase QueF [Chloroflexota bacterium]